MQSYAISDHITNNNTFEIIFHSSLQTNQKCIAKIICNLYFNLWPLYERLLQVVSGQSSVIYIFFKFDNLKWYISNISINYQSEFPYKDFELHTLPAWIVEYIPKSNKTTKAKTQLPMKFVGYTHTPFPKLHNKL